LFSKMYSPGRKVCLRILKENARHAGKIAHLYPKGGSEVSQGKRKGGGGAVPFPFLNEKKAALLEGGL